MTGIGDISFGAEFFDKNGKNPEVLIEQSRVPSDVEPIMGTFKSHREGTLILSFDNSFSWFNPKLLSYKVALFQPSFHIIDDDRSRRSRSLLHTISADIVESEEKVAKAQQRYNELEDSIISIGSIIFRINYILLISSHFSYI